MILHLTIMKICRKNFKIFDHIDCKIFAFKVKKNKFFNTLQDQFIWLWTFLTLIFFTIEFQALNLYGGELSWESRKKF